MVFVQSDMSTDDFGFNHTFQTWVEKSWEDIKAELIQLNNEAPDNVQYKLIF